MSAYLVYPPSTNNHYYHHQAAASQQAYPSYGSNSGNNNNNNQYGYEANRGDGSSPQQWMMNQYGTVVSSSSPSVVDHHQQRSQPTMTTTTHNNQISSTSSSDYNSFISIDYYNEEDLERDRTNSMNINNDNNYNSITQQQTRQRYHNRQPSHDSSMSTTHSVASSVAGRSSQPTTTQQQQQFVNNKRVASPVGSAISGHNNNNNNNYHQYHPTSNNFNNNNNNYNNNGNNNNNIYFNNNNSTSRPEHLQTIHVQHHQTIPPLSLISNANHHITHQINNYSSLETDSSVDICTVKDDHIWMIDNLVTIEEAEQLIDIYQDTTRRNQEALIQQQILFQQQQQRRSTMSVRSSMRRGGGTTSYSSYGGNDEILTFPTTTSSPDRVQHIEFTNEEFANFIFDQLKDVLPPDQSKLYGEKIGKTFELGGIYEKFSVYELRPGEKIEKSKGEDKYRIIEVESDNNSNNNNRNRFTTTTNNERYHEKSFLTCLICLKGVVDFQQTNEQKLFGVNFYDMSKERPEHFIVLDHVGKSCLFSNNAQLFEVVENHGTENVYLLAVNVMYKSAIITNQSSLNNSTSAAAVALNGRSDTVVVDRERSLSVSSLDDGSSCVLEVENVNQYREILQKQKQQKKTAPLGGKYLMWAFGTSFIVITSFFLQTGIKVNKPIIAKLLSMISKQLNI